MIRRPQAITAAVAAVALTVAAGCGGGGGGGDAGADPAGAAPQGTPIYVSASIKPEGDQKAALDAFSQRLVGVENPGKEIQEAITKAAADSKSSLNYQDDIEPWLGDTAAFAITKLSGDEGEGAFIVAVSDTDKAKETLEKAADEGKNKKSEYEGVTYYAASSGAAGLVGDYMVISSDLPAFKQVVDAQKGESLADDSKYKDSAAADSEGKLATLYIDTKTLITQLSTSQQLGGQGAQLNAILGQLGSEPVTGSLTGTATTATLEIEGPAAASATADTQSSLLPELPGDSWAAFGIPNLGKGLKAGLTQLGSQPGAGQVQQAIKLIEQQTGLSIDRDIVPASGDAAFFASGTSIATLSGGLIVEATDPAAAARVLARLGRLAAQAGRSQGTSVRPVAGGFALSSPQLPKPVTVALRGDRWVVLYGDVGKALTPATKLGDDPAFKAAAQSLDGAPVSFYLAFQPIAALVESAGSSSDSSTQQALRVLKELSTLAFGGKSEGGKSTARFVLSLN